MTIGNIDDHRTLRVPEYVYRHGWRAVVAAWLGLEVAAMFDHNPSHTWTARTRPLIHANGWTRLLFVLFIGWLTKHYLIDPCQGCRHCRT